MSSELWEYFFNLCICDVLTIPDVEHPSLCQVSYGELGYFFNLCICDVLTMPDVEHPSLYQVSYGSTSSTCVFVMC